MPRLQGYSVRKAAQVVAYFAIRQGGRINVLKLAKLIYLADRGHLAKFDSPILYDRFVSMPHGPANSLTLNYVQGFSENSEDWDSFISDKEGYNVGLARGNMAIEDLDELSRAETVTLEETWNQFGGMNPFALRDYTHAHCPEWEDPNGSSNPIPYERVLKHLGKDPDAADRIAEAIDEDRALAGALATAD